MSIAELKQTADKLTAKERAWLRAYLFAKERATSPEWKTEMTRRRKRLQAGQGVAATTAERRTRKTASKSA